jgi:hypothetical protein
MPFVNDDGTPHSAVMIPAEGPLPNMAEEAAIPKRILGRPRRDSPKGRRTRCASKLNPLRSTG